MEVKSVLELKEADEKWKQVHLGLKGKGYTCVQNEFNRREQVELEPSSVYLKYNYGLDDNLYIEVDIPIMGKDRSSTLDEEKVIGSSVHPFIKSESRRPLLFGVLESIGFGGQYQGVDEQSTLTFGKRGVRGFYLTCPDNLTGWSGDGLNYSEHGPERVLLAIQKLESALNTIHSLEIDLSMYDCKKL